MIPRLSRRIDIDKEEHGFQTLVPGHGSLFHDHVLGPLMPLPAGSVFRFVPELFALRYDIHFNYSEYYVYEENIEVVTWETAPVTFTGGGYGLRCFINYKKHSGETIGSVMGALSTTALLGWKPERAFGKRNSLLPPRWYAKACLDMYTTYVAYHEQGDA